MNRTRQVVSAVMNAPLWAVVLGTIVILAATAGLSMVLEEWRTEYIGVTIGFAVVVLAAVYFSARLVRYFLRGDAKTRMVVILVGLAVLHLAGVLSYSTYPFGHQTGRSLAEEMYDVDFWVFPAILVFTWALISVLVMLRYRVFELTGATLTLRFLSVGICIVLAAFATGMSDMFPPALEVFSTFGADLPSPTLLVWDASKFWWVIPVVGAVLAVVIISAGAHRTWVARAAFDGQIALLMLANASLFAVLGALFLPHYKLCETELQTGFTRLHAAAMLGHTDSALRLVDRGVPLDAADLTGGTPFFHAVAGNHFALAKELAARGAKVDTNSQRGTTALHAAASRGRTEVAVWLLEKGARVNPVTNWWGYTPLHYAAIGGHVETAILLLDRGADINAEDDEGQTPLDRALELKNEKFAKVVIERGGIRSTKESRQLKKEHRDLRTTQSELPGSCKGV